MTQLFNYIDIDGIGRLIGKGINCKASGIKEGVEIPKKVVIPFSIENILIKGISAFSFYRCYDVEEFVIEARIIVIESAAFSGCKNLKKINIPSTCETFCECAIDGRIDEIYPSGPLSIYFEPNTKVNRFDNAAIANFRKVNVFIYDQIYPNYSTYLFGGVTKLRIFSSYSYLFCGKKTITFYTRNMKKCRKFSIFPFLFVLFFS